MTSAHDPVKHINESAFALRDCLGLPVSRSSGASPRSAIRRSRAVPEIHKKIISVGDLVLSIFLALKKVFELPQQEHCIFESESDIWRLWIR